MSKLRFVFAPVLAVWLAGCVVPDISAERPSRSDVPSRPPHGAAKMVPVIEVENVTVHLLESFPEQIHITARGQANSVATDAELRPRGVRDGVHEFDFLARLPRGPVTMMMGPITARHSMTRPPRLSRSPRLRAEQLDR
ncbi:MAG: hypothetical protein M3463_13240 [Verrucomicrobiota bacterium]|nr:hypothetical protein [Verrucomicrobiota bacterium]